MITEESCSYRWSQLKREAIHVAGRRAGLEGIPNSFETHIIPSRAPNAQRRAAGFDMILINFSIALANFLLCFHSTLMDYVVILCRCLP